MSSRNGGYRSVIRPALAATRSTHRFRPSTKSKICSGTAGHRQHDGRDDRRGPISPALPQLPPRLSSCQPSHDPPPVNTAMMMYCGMASSHHLTRVSPRDSRPGYSTSSRAG